MKTLAATSLLLVIATGSALLWAQQRPADTGSAQSDKPVERGDAPEAVRFAAVDVLIDSGATPLAAYQFELQAATGRVRIVGLEGNADLPFRDPPYYDPAAMRGDRVIVASYSVDAPKNLPTGKVRIATVHVQITGDEQPRYETKLVAAATADGKPIDAKLTLH